MRTKNENKAPAIKIERPRTLMTKAKAIVAPAWAPQPNPLTRAEIQKLVIDQIG